MKNEKIENPSELEVLIQKAKKLQQLRTGFWIVRGSKNAETRETNFEKRESGWQILNINRNGLVTLFNSQNEVFHIQISELAKINQDLFNL